MEGQVSNLFMKLANNYGLFGAVIIIALILLLFYGGMIIIKVIAQIIKHKISGEGNDTKKNINLFNHPSFSKLDFLMNHKLKNVHTTCLIRKQLYIDIMTQRIKNIQNVLKEFIKTDLNTLQKHELYIKIQSILDDANTKAIQDAIKNGVPEFVINAMNEKISIGSKIFMEQIKGYCYNEYLFSDNIQRMGAVLDLIVVAINGYMCILQESLGSFNGDIASLVYKGINCKNCKVCVHDDFLKRIK